MMQRLYRAMTVLATPLIALYLRRRKDAGKEDPKRFRERLGVAGAERPQGRLVWIHGASVGEALTALPLIGRIQETHPELQLLVTTGTVTSAQLMAERLPARALHQYAPIDRPDAVRGFLDHWRPDLAIWIESEFWPNLLADTQARGVPMILVNGRMSDRSYRRWLLMRGVIRRLLGGFALCLAQSEQDAERLRDLGAAQVLTVGNLKSAGPALPVDEAAYDALRGAVGTRPRWLAASTHAGEETIAAACHSALAADHPGLLTIIAPRHPERGPTIAAGLRNLGLTVALRSAGDAITEATDIYMADNLGELGLFYRLADIAFVGGSLVPHGGQNLLEPARLDCAILHGPHMANFAAFTAAFAANRGAIEVAGGKDLATAVGGLLDNGDERRRLMAAARVVAEAEAGVLERIAAAIEPYLVPTIKDGGP
ncbi:MAG: 3-deoxy-D-manno-octulosonic acid transferase [Alphaproteobacteria bacterium]